MGERVIRQGIVLVAVLLALWAKNGHCDVMETEASWYSTEACKYNKSPDNRCPTASGRSLYELERNGVLFAASWDYPLGTRIRVCTDDEVSCTRVVVLDRGPAKRLVREGRRLDLGKQAFEKLAPASEGVIRVRVYDE